jgi:protoporphyrinogen oxidase
MGAIPDQLATGLPDGTVRLGATVAAITPGGVGLAEGEEIRAEAVMVATDAATACRLLPDLRAPAWNGVTTFYHSLPTAAPGEPILRLDPDSDGLIANTVVMTSVSPRYSGDGRSLISSSVVGPRRDEPRLDALVRDRLGALHQVSPADLELVAVYRIDRAQPAAPPPLPVRRNVRVGERRYVCGDWRDTPSIQGALVSGRRAARVFLHDTGGQTSPPS